MEVPKVKKLCNELNQMGVKHLIFTLDNVSLKTFGDSDSIKILIVIVQIGYGVREKGGKKLMGN